MATSLGGYMGKVALVDLTTQTVNEYPWTEEQRKAFIGGKIMAAKILCDNLTGSEKPFSGENLIVIATGPLKVQSITHLMNWVFSEQQN